MKKSMAKAAASNAGPRLAEVAGNANWKEDRVRFDAISSEGWDFDFQVISAGGTPLLAEFARSGNTEHCESTAKSVESL